MTPLSFRRPGVARALVLAAGSLTALGFAPWHAVPLMPLGIAALFVLLAEAGTHRQAFALGWFFGFGQFLAGLYWIGNSFAQQSDVPEWIAPFAVTGLAMALAFYPASATAAARFLGGGLWIRAITLALLLVAGEWLRGVLFTGFPWNPAGAIWVNHAGLRVLAADIGVYGLSLVTILTGTLLGALVLSRQRVAFRVTAGLLLVAVVGATALRNPAPPAPTDGGPVTRIRIVQANIPQAEKWDRRRQGDHFARYLEMSARPAQGAPADIIIWPETAVTSPLEEQVARQALIASVLQGGGAVLTGAPRRDGASGTMRYYNSLFALGPGGPIAARYDKAHLVPFGEYLPFRAILGRLGLGPLVESRGDFSPGPGPRTLHIADLPPFSPLICYEVIFPGRVLDRSDRPDWILNITNDAWFGASAGPYQHLALARFRAAEEGLPLVRAASTGISAVIGADGALLGMLDVGRQAVLDSVLPPAGPPTRYAAFGDAPLLTLIFLFLAWRGALAGSRRRRPA